MTVKTVTSPEDYEEIPALTVSSSVPESQSSEEDAEQSNDLDAALKRKISNRQDRQAESGQKNWLHSMFGPLALPAPSYPLNPSPSVSQSAGFVGLVNQAMTCYLNSLLQALFMTPEFRNALYKWQYKGSKPAKSVPFQLQKLFLNLQMSSRSAVETTDLTLSFGWGTGDVWHQHDVQELCRVMFDALEQVFQNTQQANLINQLYQGKMIDYVKCLECGREKSREDTYLDIPLPVRPFGSTIAYTSVEEAMQAFVQPEILDGNNQYDCESCGKKVNAHKGLKFSTLPYLLTLHLKRFDFDYSTMHRIKLNDKVTFPKILNLSRFVTKAGWTMSDEIPMEEGCVSIGRADDSSTADSALDDDSVPPVHEPNNECPVETITEPPHDDDDEGIEMSGQGSVAASGSSSGSESDRLAEDHNRDDLIDINLEHGGVKSSDSVDAMASSHLYELYAIMIHSGSASGGHYYAYIKDFVSDQWICFNDQTVTQVTSEDIEKTYGGGPSRGYYSGVFSSSTNAYMLMYRLIDKERNCLPMTPAEFPPHIQALLTNMKEEEEKERANKARQEQMVKVKVFWKSKGGSSSSSNETKFALFRDSTLQEALYTAYRNFRLQDVPEEHCRLVAYVYSNDQMIASFDGRENEQIGSIISQLREFSGDDAPVTFLLESRTKDQTFLPYAVDDIKVEVYGILLEKEEVISLDTIQVPRTCDISGLADSIKKWLPHVLCGNDPVTTNILVFHEDVPSLSGEGFRLLTDEKTLVRNLNLLPYPIPKVFVTPQLNPIETYLEKSCLSNYSKFLNKIKHVVVLNITLPDISEDSLEANLIPPLSEQKVATLNNNKAIDGCSGESLMNMVTAEEENLCCATTSDQSTSEDSSLTDSERTIIGEPAVENESSSPSDSDHQMSSPSLDLHTYEPYSLSQQCEMNGDIDWDSTHRSVPEVQVQPVKSFVLKVTPYTQNDQRMLKVVVNQRADWNWLLSALEPYIGVEMKYVSVSGFDPSSTLPALQSNITLELRRPLRPDEWKYKIIQFCPNSDLPLDPVAEWIVTRGQTVAEVKRGLAKYLKRIFPNAPPLSQCRLRKKNRRSVERPLDDSEVLDGSNGTALSLLIEKVDGDVNLPPNHKLVFTKRVHPHSKVTEPFVQIALNPYQPELFEDKLIEMSGIPRENLKAAQGLNQFPWEFKGCDYEWRTVIDVVNNYKRTDTSLVLLYMDNRESEKSGSKDGQDEVICSRPTPSPRREKPLKIYLDNSFAASSPSPPPPVENPVHYEF